MKHVTAPHTTKKEKSRLPITTKESMGLQCLLPACLVAVEETFISAARVPRERHGATNSALGARVRGRWLITPDSSTQHRRSTRIRPSTKKNREPLPQSERRRLPGNICGNRDSRATEQRKAQRETTMEATTKWIGELAARQPRWGGIEGGYGLVPPAISTVCSLKVS